MSRAKRRNAVRKRIEIQGVVQGVGFRPFVYRIARRFDIHGRVLNSSDGVVIEAEGGDAALDSFLSLLKTDLPPLARIDRCRVQRPSGAGRFAILLSNKASAVPGRFALVPPDIATCAECERRLYFTPGQPAL